MPPAESPAAIAAASPAARAARSTGKVPRVVGAAVKKVVRLVCHQKFGDVGAAEENRASFAEPLDDDSVFIRDVIFAELAAAFGTPTRHFERTLDGQRDTVKRSEVIRGLCVCELGFGGAGFSACGVGIDVNVGVEGGIEFFDASEMGVDDLDRGDFFRANGGGLFD